MTNEEVRELVRRETFGNLTTANDHRIKLEQALVLPRIISIIDRRVKDGRLNDEVLSVWLVAQENSTDGYRIVMRQDGLQFGLASPGLKTDKHMILCGWYGGLLSAFLGM